MYKSVDVWMEMNFLTQLEPAVVSQVMPSPSMLDKKLEM